MNFVLFMKSQRRHTATIAVVVACCASMPSLVRAGPFTAGNLAVLQADASVNNTTASIIELSPTTVAQTPSNIISIDGATMPNALRFSGSASSTGYLSNSADRSLLTVTGHNASTASGNANTITARAVGSFNAAGALALSTTYTGGSGNQCRSATSLNNNLWFIADQGGIYSNGTSTASPAGNFRSIRCFGGSVYVASTTTSSAVSIIPAPSGGTLTSLPGLPLNAATQDFYLISSGANGVAFDVLYLLTATTNTAGSISKYSLVAGSWVSNGSYTTAFGGFGLAASASAGGAALYVSTGAGALTGNSVLKLTDAAGYNSAIAITTANNATLYTAPATKIIKGVAFAPVEAAAPAVSVTINSASIVEGDVGSGSMSFTVTRSANTSAFSLDYATANDTAVAPADYTATSGTLTFAAGGALSQTVVVSINGDTLSEPGGERFFVNLSNLVNQSGITTLAGAQGIGTIIDDEPVISIPHTSSNLDVLTPNTATWNPSGVSVNGTTFVNLGLQGVGRIPASAKDPATGESLGSISDMQITGWTKNANGTYSGTLNTLPDRGYNNGTIYSNFAARINAFTFNFTPYTASTPTTAQNQVAMTFAGSTRLTYNNSGTPTFTTGLLADGVVNLFGVPTPAVGVPTTQSDGTVANRLTLDSEGMVLDQRLGKSGSGWISDEYGPYIYHFNSAKQIDGQLQLPAALLPHKPAGTLSFVDTNVDGRRTNQGMEGLAQSPDGSKLFGLMQSATLQDSGSSNQSRYNTRLLVYDISSSDTPSDPVAQYVIQLPRLNSSGNGSSPDRNGAQSSILAINDHQILILSRDGNGRGSSGSPVFKSILLADLTTGTNIDGIYDTENAAVSPNGVLAAGVTPLSWSEALNMIGKLGASNEAEVAKFGLNLNAGPGDINTICEKWEAMALVPCNDAVHPNDYFLFVGNDNDFLSGSGAYLDANGAIQSYDAGLENDTLILVWRVRLQGPGMTLQAWRSSAFGTTATNGALADNADYDGDGIPNLMEFALGISPSDSTPNQGVNALPFGIASDPSSPLLSDRLSLCFTIDSPSPSDITYTVQATEDLVNWTDVARNPGTGTWSWLAGGTPHIVTSAVGSRIQVKVGDAMAADAVHPQRMMRLKVSSP